MIKLSVVIPVYNQEDLIVRAIESIPKRDDVEIIVVDDGSTDNTSANIFENLEKFNKNIRMVVFKENQGVANALNSGLELIEGEYYMALGSDDYFYTDRLNDFIDNDLNDKVDMVYFCLERNDGSLIEPNEETRSLWVGSTKAYRREIISDTLYPDGKRACEDLVFDDLIRQKPHTYRFTGKIIKHYNFPREGSLTDLANKGKISEEFIGKTLNRNQ